MFAYDRFLEPSIDAWEEYEKPALITEAMREICEDITKKGCKSKFHEIFDLLYEHIEDNLEMFVDEVTYDNE